MTSSKQLEANRKNAVKSTGPKTRRGKTVVRKNATQHGILSTDVLLPDEEPSEFVALQTRLRKELDPKGEIETLLVDRVVFAAWRLRRLGRIEVGVIAWQSLEEVVTQAQGDAGDLEIDEMRDLMLQMSVRVSDENLHAKAMKTVQDARIQQRDAVPHLGRSFVRDAEGPDACSKLIRYETSIERSLFRSLHELQRLQARRRGEPVATPVAVDVSGVEAV